MSMTSFLHIARTSRTLHLPLMFRNMFFRFFLYFACGRKYAHVMLQMKLDKARLPVSIEATLGGFGYGNKGR
jgi:hypothetical protein